MCFNFGSVGNGNCDSTLNLILLKTEKLLFFVLIFWTFQAYLHIARFMIYTKAYSLHSVLSLKQRLGTAKNLFPWSELSFWNFSEQWILLLQRKITHNLTSSTDFFFHKKKKIQKVVGKLWLLTCNIFEMGICTIRKNTYQILIHLQLHQWNKV